MFYLPQLGKSDCGVACLKMILADLNKDRQYLFLPCDENHGMYSFKDLQDIAKCHGLTLAGFKVTDKEEIRKCNLPAIIRMTTKENCHHAVVLTKVNKNSVVFIDPHIGKVKMKIDEFFVRWDATGLFVTKFEKQIYPYDSIEPLTLKHKIACLGLQILSGLLFASGVYFISPNGPYYIALILIGLGLIVELLLRGYLFKLMKHIDEYFLNRYHDVNDRNYYEYYVRCQNFKKTYLTTQLNIVYSFLVSAFIIFITIFNSPYNFPITIAPIVIAAIQCLICNKKEEVELQQMADDEEELKVNTKHNDMILKVKSLQKKAYDFSKIKLLMKFSCVLLFTMTSILSMALTGKITLIDLIFDLCIQAFVYQNLLPLFSFEKNTQEVLLSKARVSNVFYPHIHHIDENN